LAGLKNVTGKNRVDYLSKLNARLKSNISYYLAGEKQGLAALHGEWTSVEFGCPPSTKVALLGYSQGSMIVP